jgi:hypothetical protein
VFVCSCSSARTWRVRDCAGLRGRGNGHSIALGAGRTRIVREQLETALCAVLTALVAIVFTTC